MDFDGAFCLQVLQEKKESCSSSHTYFLDVNELWLKWHFLLLEKWVKGPPFRKIGEGSSF